MNCLQKLPTCLVVLLLSISAYSQVVDSEQQYKAAMQNAKTAFEAGMYSQSIYFYREALRIKPDAKLPRYKIEDIRTIYIDKELKENTDIQLDNVASAQQQAETKADERIEAEAQQVQIEMEKLKMAYVVHIEDDSTDVDETVDIPDLVPSQEVVKPAILQADTVGIAELPKSAAEPQKSKPAVSQMPVTKPQKMSEEEKEVRREAEQQRLRILYPDQKTVLEYDQPGKHITRIIMNVDNYVTVYLKVKHSWGATFYFVEDVDDDLKSINELIFNQKTNINNYGH